MKYCATCRRRLVRTAEWRSCQDAGHAVGTQVRPIWWIRYIRNGQLCSASARSTKRAVAERLLAEQEKANPAPLAGVLALPPGLLFEVAAAELCQEYRTNGRRSLRTVELRVRKHLAPVFAGRCLSTIRTADIRRFTVDRQARGASNGSINRDLVILKRMFTLALQSEALTARPYIPLLRENNVRRGFFEPALYEAVRASLPVHFRGIATFAYITGWRTPSEILPLEWRHVDLAAGEVRLDPGTTKNGEGRVFPCTSALRRVLEEQYRLTAGLGVGGHTHPAHVFCYLTGAKAGKRITESGFHKAWRLARTRAGCPDRIPHDFRRTAVRNLVRAGVPERIAMQLTGHKTRAVFERYNIVNAGDLQDAVRRLEQYAAAAPSADRAHT